MQRRRYLKLVGLGSIAIAGCSGSGDSPEPADSTPESGSSGDGEQGDSGGGGDGGGGQDDSNNEDSPQPETRDVEAALGELVEGESLHLVVENVRRGQGTNEFLTPDSGNEYVFVQIALKNVSGEYLTVSNLLQTRLRDSEDYQYSQTIAAGEEQTFNDGQFAPGEVERGTIAYEVPEEATGLTLVFDFDVSIIGGVERAEIDLESEASSTTTLEQDLQIDVFDVGQAIEYGDVEVAVNDVRTESSLGEFNEADEGNEFVIVDISITNNTGEQQRFSTILQMMIKDGEGYTYQEDLMGSTGLDRPFDEGTPLSDGETRRGELAYQIPEGTSPLYWVFEFELFASGDKTFWQLR